MKKGEMKQYEELTKQQQKQVRRALKAMGSVVPKDAKYTDMLKIISTNKDRAALGTKDNVALRWINQTDSEQIQETLRQLFVTSSSLRRFIHT
jgi:hypothetical protein